MTVLYVGIAAPLLEEALVWRARLPDERALLAARPGAYAITAIRPGELQFRTDRTLSGDHLQSILAAAGGELLTPVPKRYRRPLPPLEYAQTLVELQRALAALPVHVVTRIGRTRRELQQDLSRLRPEWLLLCGNATEDGCVLWEDGRGRADMLAGEHLFALLRPCPFAVCLQSAAAERVLGRAALAGRRLNTTVVYPEATPAPQSLNGAFAARFFARLLQGAAASAALEAAQRDPGDDGDANESGDTGRAPRWTGCFVTPSGALLPPWRCSLDDAPPDIHPVPRHGHLFRTTAGPSGRQRELIGGIDALAARPALPADGYQTTGGRLVTLCGISGSGRTTLALALADWHAQRGLCTGGIFELSCTALAGVADWLRHLLRLFDVPGQEWHGDPATVLIRQLRQRFADGQTALLLLTDLDHLAAAGLDRTPAAILEDILAAAPGLRVLATGRRPLGLAGRELVVAVPPLSEVDALTMFLRDLPAPRWRAAAPATGRSADDACRRLIDLAARHPQSLRLLARQLRQPDCTPERLAGAVATALAQAPAASPSVAVRVIHELCYRRLSQSAQRLFGRLSRLPDGIWCGEFAEHWLGWDALLDPDWRAWITRELEPAGWVQFEPLEGTDEGRFRIPPALLEFARAQPAPDPAWELRWIEFWQRHLDTWNELIEGRVSLDGEVTLEQDGAGGLRMQETAARLFEQTQGNWLAVVEVVAAAGDVSRMHGLLLALRDFLALSGWSLLLRELAERVMALLRHGEPGQDLLSCMEIPAFRIKLSLSFSPAEPSMFKKRKFAGLDATGRLGVCLTYRLTI